MRETTKELPHGMSKEEIMDTLVDACGHNILAAINELYGEGALFKSAHIPEAVHVAVTAANASIQIIAAALSSSDDKMSHNRWNDGAVAFAGQLIAAATTLNKSENEPKLSSSAGPDILSKALRNTETVLGRSVEADLQPGLVAAARDESAVASAAMRRRAELRGSISKHLH